MVLYGIGIISSHSDMFIGNLVDFFSFLGAFGGSWTPLEDFSGGNKAQYPMTIVFLTDINQF